MGTLLKAANPSPQTTPVSTLPNAARARPAARFGRNRKRTGRIQGKPASARLYLNKLLRRRGDASLAILAYHFEPTTYSVSEP
jgi:hypothetical protein